MLLHRPFQHLPQSLATKSGSSQLKNDCFFSRLRGSVTSLPMSAPSTKPLYQQRKYANRKKNFLLADPVRCIRDKTSIPFGAEEPRARRFTVMIPL